MTSALQNHNLAIWSAVEKTDPAHTKTFNRAGGFSGTAVNQAYQARRATELFGPIGIGWGFDELEHQIVEGAAGDKVWFAKVKLWYQHEGRRGEVIQWGATTFVGRNKNGAFTDEEAAKKSITDAVGKCLSLLGFSADVYLGQFDDQKYVNDRRREEAAKKSKVQSPKSKVPEEASREASGKGTGTQRVPGAQRTDSVPCTLSPVPFDSDLAAFRDAIAAATLESQAQRAERLLRSQRALAGRPISEVESALIASCTEAACQRIRAGSPKSKVQSPKSQNGHATPDLAAFRQPPNAQRPTPNALGPVTGEHLLRPRGSATAHPHAREGARGRESDGENAPAEPQAPSPTHPLAHSPPLPVAPGGLAADVAAFRDFCAQAMTTVDVKRGEHVLRSKRLRDRIGLGDAESELIAGWADAACRRIRAARKGT